MAATEINFLHSQLDERKQRLETVLAVTPGDANLEALLREVDSALDRLAAGTYGLCETCHDTVERDRLLADPLIRYCLDHLTKLERATLQRDRQLRHGPSVNHPPASAWRRQLWNHDAGGYLSIGPHGRRVGG